MSLNIDMPTELPCPVVFPEKGFVLAPMQDGVRLTSGASPRAPRVCYAFGHQHLGLTRSAITGRLVTALINSLPPEVDLTPYRVGRFHQQHTERR